MYAYVIIKGKALKTMILHESLTKKNTRVNQKYLIKKEIFFILISHVI